METSTGGSEARVVSMYVTGAARPAGSCCWMHGSGGVSDPFSRSGHARRVGTRRWQGAAGFTLFPTEVGRTGDTRARARGPAHFRVPRRQQSVCLQGRSVGPWEAGKIGALPPRVRGSGAGKRDFWEVDARVSRDRTGSLARHRCPRQAEVRRPRDGRPLACSPIGCQREQGVHGGLR